MDNPGRGVQASPCRAFVFRDIVRKDYNYDALGSGNRVRRIRGVCDGSLDVRFLPFL